MNKKIKKNIIFLGFICLVISLLFYNNFVLAAEDYSKYSSQQFIDAYKKDPNIINKLSEEELETWEKEITALYNIMMDPTNKGYTEVEIEQTHEILRAIKERKSNLKQSSLSEEEKKSIEDELIKAIKDKDTSKCEKILTQDMDVEARKNFKQNHPNEYNEYIQFLEDSESDEYVKQQELLFSNTLDEAYGQIDKHDTIYTNLPERTSDPNSAEQSLDDMMNDADSFINNANKLTYNPSSLENFSKTLYNIFLSVGIVISVLVGGFIGIKLMTSSVEEKAEYKKLLIPYVVGCIIVFGGFAIWKLVVTVLQGI